MNQSKFGLYFLFLETLDIRNNSVHCQQLISFFQKTIMVQPKEPTLKYYNFGCYIDVIDFYISFPHLKKTTEIVYTICGAKTTISR